MDLKTVFCKQPDSIEYKLSGFTCHDKHKGRKKIPCRISKSTEKTGKTVTVYGNGFNFVFQEPIAYCRRRPSRPFGVMHYHKHLGFDGTGISHFYLYYNQQRYQVFRVAGSFITGDLLITINELALSGRHTWKPSDWRNGMSFYYLSLYGKIFYNIL